MAAWAVGRVTRSIDSARAAVMIGTEKRCSARRTTEHQPGQQVALLAGGEQVVVVLASVLLQRGGRMGLLGKSAYVPASPMKAIG
jgi:hypothetical protein